MASSLRLSSSLVSCDYRCMFGTISRGVLRTTLVTVAEIRGLNESLGSPRIGNFIAFHDQSKMAKTRFSNF